MMSVLRERIYDFYSILQEFLIGSATPFSTEVVSCNDRCFFFLLAEPSSYPKNDLVGYLLHNICIPQV